MLPWQILQLEVDGPDRMNIKVSELSDYPPRIHVDLSPANETSAPAELEVMGLKDEFSFLIANECELQLLADALVYLIQALCCHRFATCGYQWPHGNYIVHCQELVDNDMDKLQVALKDFEAGKFSK